MLISRLTRTLGYNRLFDGEDAMVQITEKAAVTAGLPQVVGRAESIDESEKKGPNEERI